MVSVAQSKQRTGTHAVKAEARREVGCMTYGNPVMAVSCSRVPVWEHVINALLPGCQAGAREENRARPVYRLTAEARSSHVSLEVIERLSESSIAVLWRDATRCCYVDQVWISCRARVRGCCALTGEKIRRGDLVY